MERITADDLIGITANLITVDNGMTLCVGFGQHPFFVRYPDGSERQMLSSADIWMAAEEFNALCGRYDCERRKEA